MIGQMVLDLRTGTAYTSYNIVIHRLFYPDKGVD